MTPSPPKKAHLAKPLKASLLQVLRGQISLEAGVRCSFNRSHGSGRFATGSFQLDTTIDFCYYSNAQVAEAISQDFFLLTLSISWERPFC
jgi:hypothetical protein